MRFKLFGRTVLKTNSSFLSFVDRDCDPMTQYSVLGFEYRVMEVSSFLSLLLANCNIFYPAVLLLATLYRQKKSSLQKKHVHDTVLPTTASNMFEVTSNRELST